MRKETVQPPTALSSGDADEVLVQQFTREFRQILHHVKEKKKQTTIGSSSTEPGAAPGGSGDKQQPDQNEEQEDKELAFYGPVAHKLVVLVNKLLHASHALAPEKKARLLLEFGDKLYAQQEFRAASRFFYQRIVDGYPPEEREEEKRDAGGISAVSSPLPLTQQQRGEEYVRAMYGMAMSVFLVQKRRDPLVRHPGTLEKMVASLRFLQTGMETATRLEQESPHRYSWLTLNGSILMFSIAKPLCCLGFAMEVVTFLKWSILALESTVALCTTKYILWRLHIFALTCECYESMAAKQQELDPPHPAQQHLKAALKCAEYAQRVVLRLKKEEELDLPLPHEVVAILAQAQTTASMLVARAKAALSHDVLSKHLIETTFPSTAERIRMVVDTIETLTRADRKCVGVLTPPSTARTHDQMSELLEFVVEIVTPLLPPSPPPSSASEQLRHVFPLTFHMMLLRHLYRLGRVQDLVALLKAAHARLASFATTEAITELDAGKCRHELQLFDALAKLKRLADSAASEGERGTGSGVPGKPSKLPLPPPRALLKLAQALTTCLYQGAGSSMSRTNRDLLLAVSLKLWHEYATPMVEELDATDPSGLPMRIVKIASELLLSIHLTFMFVDVDDLMLHGEVVLRLTSLLRLQTRGRLTIQVLRGILERVNSKRDELASFDSHFQALLFGGDAVALSCSTVSFDVDHQLSQSDVLPKALTPSARDRVGVFGTGSQFGSTLHDICCLQTDLVLLLYQTELEDANAVDSLPMCATSEREREALKPRSLLKTTEEKLLTECRKNGYTKTLLNIQLMRHHANDSHSTEKHAAAVADQSMKTLQRIEIQERELQSRLKKAAQMPAAADPRASRPSSSLESSNVPLPPVIVSRSSTAITVKIIAFQPTQPSLRKRTIAYYMVFAKPAGAGTTVSMNNNELPGTSEPVYPPQVYITIGGLLPNESYVFAVAAFDTNGEVIQGIGHTSNPVVALHPLPVALCYGYLAQGCHELDARERASRAARALYNTLVSREALSSRALWKANPFYRHALKREVVARLPVPVLNAAIHAILILCHEEIGDQERDGMLHDPEQRSLVSRQVEALEACKKVAIGVELASAAANTEAIRVLCFKGYRLLLPLLHLHQCDAMTFAPLMTLYQALRTIPPMQWDVDTKSIFARIAFELLRIGLENRHCAPVINPSLASDILQQQEIDTKNGEHNGAGATKSNEYRSICEAVAAKTALDASSSVVSTPPQQPPAATTAAAAPTSKPAIASASTPQPTPRQPGSGENEPLDLPLLPEILQQANFSVAEALTVLESQASKSPSDIRQVEYVCKLAAIALQQGEDSAVETCLAAIKLKGKMSEQFRTTIAALGGAHLLPEIVVVAADPLSSEPVATTAASPSAPTTARSTKTPRQGLQKEAASDEPAVGLSDLLAIETPSTSRSAVEEEHLGGGGEDDDFLYLWGGEIFFLQSLLLYRKIVKLQSEVREVDANHGPGYDPTFELLRAGRPYQQQHVPASDPMEIDTQRVDSLEQEQQGEPATPTKEQELVAVFGQFVEKISASCQLFRLGKAWQALQASCQYLWNAIWIVWMSPDRFGASSPTWLDQFSVCVDSLLDMVEAVVVAVKEQKSMGLTFSSGTISDTTQSQVVSLNQSLLLTSLASTVAASSAMNALGATDMAWMVQFVSYGVKALCTQQKWEKVVLIGKKFHFLLSNNHEGGARFLELHFPVLMYAQRQLVATANATLEAAETQLGACIREFTESEAKKKKKKSRLVVETIPTPEEIEFRSKKSDMDETIQRLTEERNQQQSELLQLTGIHESLTKSMNKCIQSLDSAHALVEQFRRGSADGKEQSTLRKQILGVYNHSILLSRQKRQQRLLCQAYQELGDFYLACGDMTMAVKNWHEGLDNAFGALHVVQSWRDVLGVNGLKKEQGGADGVHGADQIAGDGLWVGLLSCSILSKLVMHATSSSCFQIVEYSLMAAKVFGRLFASSLPHPTKEFLYGSYELGAELWPGRDLLVDSERVSPFSFGIMLVLVPEVLLQYESYAVAAMPVIAGYEFVARYCLENRDHVSNARRLRMEALVQCGRIKEAMVVLAELLHGVETPSMQETSKPNTLLLAALSYHDDKSVNDQANAAALVWFTALDAQKIHDELRQLYAEPLVFEILVGVLRLLTSLSHHESSLGASNVLLRSAAEKMARALLPLIPQRKRQEESSGVGNQSTSQLPSWDDEQAAALRGEILLQQSYLAYAEGRWDHSRELSSNALEARMETMRNRTAGEHDSIAAIVPLDLAQELKYCLFRRQSTFVAKCRVQRMLCDLAQSQFHTVLAHAELALNECRENGEDHLCERIQILRAQTNTFLGKRDNAESDLENLRVSSIARYTNCTLTYVHALLMSSSLQHAKAIATAMPDALVAVKDRLLEAERVLDGLLERAGWIGVGSDVDPHSDKRMSLYNPAIVTFIHVKRSLAQALVECKIDDSSETSSKRQERVLQTIESGLRAVSHTTKRVASAKAMLLLLKGSVLKKRLVWQQHSQQLALDQKSDQGKRQENGLEEEDNKEQMFDASAGALTECVDTSIRSGGYDRRLVRLALLELVDLYGQKLLLGKEDEHVQAAFHYLSVAVQVQTHEFNLFETLELQNGTIASLDKLPPFISEAINGNGTPGTQSVTDKKANESPAPIAANAKKAGSAATTGIADAAGRTPPPDCARVINYYLRLQREQHVLPVCCEIQQESALWLHSFLSQNHSSYAASCCLPGLPNVPHEDPEIKASLVCVQWGRDLTPAISDASVDDTSANRSISRLTIYFTLGTTRIDISCSEECASAATSRMEEFLRAPLLSKKLGLNEKHVNEIRTQLSHLRTQMEDEESLVIDRGAFDDQFKQILHSIQVLFRPRHDTHATASDHGKTRESQNTSVDPADERSEPQASSDLCDVFGNPIHLACTLEMVRHLEDLFMVHKGVYTCDTVLCYFLRDLLGHGV